MSTLSLADPAVASLVGALAPYARFTLERAARTAHRLHAEEVAPEHLLQALLEDETAAATRVVLHAFADPQTIAAEVLALCPGILVVASGRSLPFSVRGVRALEAARATAAAEGAAEVTAEHVLRAAAQELEPELARALAAAGYRTAAALPGAAAGDAVPDHGPLFRHFADVTRRALGAACRAAARLERDAIGPAHLVLGALEADPELGGRVGLGAVRARMVLLHRDDDPTPLPARRLAPDPALVALLRGVGAGADTAALLERLLSHGAEELRLLLTQQKVTGALLERARGAFQDPEPPSSAG